MYQELHALGMTFASLYFLESIPRTRGIIQAEQKKCMWVLACKKNAFALPVMCSNEMSLPIHADSKHKCYSFHKYTERAAYTKENFKVDI
jgi:hypothetical protein